MNRPHGSFRRLRIAALLAVSIVAVLPGCITAASAGTTSASLAGDRVFGWDA